MQRHDDDAQCGNVQIQENALSFMRVCVNMTVM